MVGRNDPRTNFGSAWPAGPGAGFRIPVMTGGCGGGRGGHAARLGALSARMVDNDPCCLPTLIRVPAPTLREHLMLSALAGARDRGRESRAPCEKLSLLPPDGSKSPSSEIESTRPSPAGECPRPSRSLSTRRKRRPGKRCDCLASISPRGSYASEEGRLPSTGARPLWPRRQRGGLHAGSRGDARRGEGA